ncbi:MAG TPA: hypothetical protein VF170_15045, partial [Planctomycetaceae bacterium]
VADGLDLPVTETRTPLPVTPDGPFAIIAGVIGRPTRDQAVIDAGRDLLGTAAAVVWPPNSGAKVFAVEEGFTVLRLEGNGHDLSIGDAVAVVPEREIRPRPGQAVLVGGDAAWRVEAACGGP